MTGGLIYAIGIDLSIRATGIAHSDGTVQVLGIDGITNQSWADRLDCIGQLATRIIAWAGPWRRPTVVIEGLDMAQSYGAQIERSCLWCLVVEALGQHSDVYVAPSPQVKMYATGKGSGPKAMTIAAVKAQWPQFDVGRDDNKADAVACCAIAAQIAGRPFSEVSATQLRALDKVLSINVAPEAKARKPRRLTPDASH